MDEKTVVTLVVGAFVAALGYVATYVSNLRLTKRKERLERIDRQLRELYGPLYALLETGEKSWLAFRQQIGRPTGSFWHATPPPNDQERAAWRLWMVHVLMPINLRIEEVIADHSDLLEGPEMPACFLALMAHIASYKAVLKSWESGDLSRHLAVVNFPHDVHEYVKSCYLELKGRQQQLIGQLS